MTILNIGSINRDRIYVVDHFPKPGETLAARSAAVGLGGKGLNQSIAIHKAGGSVLHVGAIGEGDTRMRDEIQHFGLDTSGIAEIQGCMTGSALIVVDANGENQIVLDPGANTRLSVDQCLNMIAQMTVGDSLLLQNETNILEEVCAFAQGRGIRVVVAAAPFDADRILPVLPNIDLLAVNEIEFSQLCDTGIDLPSEISVLVTKGPQGASFIMPNAAIHRPAFCARTVDTTGAGDTTLGSFLARLDDGCEPETALSYAMAAAALQVGRQGAASAIPNESEVLELLGESATSSTC